jgi:hypothetical protein
MRKRLSECSRRPPQLALTAIVVGERFCFVGGSARVPISKQRTRSSSGAIAPGVVMRRSRSVGSRHARRRLMTRRRRTSCPSPVFIERYSLLIGPVSVLLAASRAPHLISNVAVFFLAKSLIPR